MNISGKYKIAFWASIVLNLIFIVYLGTTFILTKTGALDEKTVSSGLDTLCDRDYETPLKEGLAQGGGDETNQDLALLNYACGTGDAKSYYEDGYNQYAQSLGLPATTDEE